MSAFHFSLLHDKLRGLPSDLDSKESACNMGDLSLIPGLGRSPGKGNRYLLQYSGLVRQTERLLLSLVELDILILILSWFNLLF